MSGREWRATCWATPYWDRQHHPPLDPLPSMFLCFDSFHAKFGTPQWCRVLLTLRGQWQNIKLCHSAGLWREVCRRERWEGAARFYFSSSIADCACPCCTEPVHAVCVCVCVCLNQLSRHPSMTSAAATQLEPVTVVGPPAAATCMSVLSVLTATLLGSWARW